MTASSDSLGLAIGATLAGRFRVTGILGAGAMGAVYEVRDEKDQVFAAKTLLHLSELTRNTETAARFVREGGGAVELSDPHVVRFFESGIDPVLGIPYFIMERMTGIDLDSLVSRSGRCTLPWWRASRSRLARASPTLTPAASCTATSSRRTCSCTAKATAPCA